jgi:hypothetical protein
MEFIGYHSTTDVNAKQILKSNFKIKIDVTKKSGPWLGCGVYFFIEDIYSVVWCIYEYARIYGIDSINKENILSNMAIIYSQVIISDDRLFDMTYYKFQRLYDITYKHMLSSKKFIGRLENLEEIPGVVIDYMFNTLEYNKSFDGVKQLYRINEDHYENHLDYRVKGVPQCQYCIKKTDLIKSKNTFEFKDSYDKYSKEWGQLFNSESFEQIIDRIKIKKMNKNNIKSNSKCDDSKGNYYGVRRGYYDK